MKKLAILFLIGLIMIGGAMWMLWQSPERRAAEAMLDNLDAAFATKDRTQITVALGKSLTDDAQIKLTVAYLLLFQMNDNQQATEKVFTKAEFLPFVDNILYSLNDYSGTSEIRSFVMRSNEPVADMQSLTQARAEGKSYARGLAIDSQYASNPDCKGEVVFTPAETGLSAAWKTLDCKINIRIVPKEGEMQKLQQEGLKGILQQGN